MSQDHRWYGRDHDDRDDRYSRDYAPDFGRGERQSRGEDRSWRDDSRAGEDREHHAWRPFGDTGPTNYGSGSRDRNDDRGGYGPGQGGPGQGGRDGRDERAGTWAFGGGRGRDSRGDGGFGETGGRYSASYERDRDDYRGPRDGRGEDGRNWLDKAGDEVQSWFGDRDAQRRRQADEMRAGDHRGRGPKGYRRSDERIREDVSDRMSEDPWLDASDIEVRVENGEVTLSGTVANRRDKRHAEDLVERISAVDHVQNNLRVRRDDHAFEVSASAPETSGGAGSGRA